MTQGNASGRSIVRMGPGRRRSSSYPLGLSHGLSRLRGAVRRSGLGAVVLLLAVSPTIGAIRPSFGVYRLAWAATHVVVVTEGERIDGDVVVVESWWGDLRPDATLRIPELAAFADDAARTIDYERHGEADATEPRVVTGRRMVLFLKSAEDG